MTHCKTCDLHQSNCTSCYGINRVLPSCGCEPGKYEQTNSRDCLSECLGETHINPVTQMCEACADECLTCADNPRSCVTCDKLRYLSNERCYCKPQFKGPEGDCYECFTGCRSCFGRSYNECLTCLLGYYYHGFSCWQVCPQGTFPSAELGACVRCNPTCLSCRGPSNLDCKECQVTFLRLYAQTNSSQYLCTPACPSKYYESMQRVLECRQCPALCT